MQLCQDPFPAGWTRIVYASIHDTLITLNDDIISIHPVNSGYTPLQGESCVQTHRVIPSCKNPLEDSCGLIWSYSNTLTAWAIGSPWLTEPTSAVCLNMTPNIVVLLWNTPEGALVSIVKLLSQDNHIETHYENHTPLVLTLNYD